MLGAWVTYPLAMLALASGSGELVQQAAGRALAAAVRLPCGLVLLIVVMDLLTRTTATATLAVPAAVLLGLAGLIVAARELAHAGRGAIRARMRRSAPGIACALVVFCVYAAPVVLSGQATLLGYDKLNDTSIWLAIVDQALAHGRTISDLQPSGYSVVLSGYLTVGYPIAAFLPLGLGHLQGEDIAWLVDPWMATVAAMLALALYALARKALASASPWIAAIIAALAAQSTLLYGYYLWGGIKEAVGALLVACAALTVPPALRTDSRVRDAIPLVLVIWALVVALSPGGLVWIAPGGALAVGLLIVAGHLPWLGGARAPRSVSVRTIDVRRALTRSWRTAVVGVLAVGLGLLLLLRHGGFLQRFRAALTGGSQLGVLPKPLNPLQLAGVWPTGDFRSAPSQPAIAYALITVVLVCAATAFVLALRAGRWETVLYLLFALVGAGVTITIASPWVGGKALASASPALPFAALCTAAIVARRRVVAGRALIVLIGLGIVWGNALGYHDVSLAPRALYSSLASVAPAATGYGPTLMSEYSVYGVNHFLRAGAPESPSGQRTRTDPLSNGQTVPIGKYVDLNELDLASTLQYRTIVLQSSPADTRPAEPYSLVRSNRFWQLWRRPATIAPRVLADLPIGDITSALSPGGAPTCSRVHALAQIPGVTELVADPAQDPIVIDASTGSHPASWNHGALLAMHGAGTARIPIDVPSAGRYTAWLGGSIQSSTSLLIDGRPVGSIADENQQAGQYSQFGEIALAAGEHLATVRHSSSLLAPGSGQVDIAGPLVLSTDAPAPALITVPAADAGTLCGRSLSWIDALG